MDKMKRILVVSLLPLLLALSILAEANDDRDIFEYNRVKGVLLEKFVDFIDWPSGSDVSDKSKPFIINVIGKNPFIIIEKGKKTTEDWLNRLYSNKKIKGKIVKIRSISDVKDIPASNLLFISNSEKKNLDKIISFAKENHVLTVADSAGFAKKGVHINFYVEKGNIRFEICETAIFDSGFKPSSHVLKLADIVCPRKKRR